MGEHRPEVVFPRLLAAQAHDAARLAQLEARMANWDEVLADLQAVATAAADVKDRHLSEAADALAPLVADLKHALGLSAPASSPSSPEQPAI